MPDTAAVPFGDLPTLEAKLQRARQAPWPPQRNFVLLDEVQTGMFRTGRFLAAHHYGLDPDMVVLSEVASSTAFTIPDVQWGMKNPSNFLLRVNDKVEN